MKVLCLILLAVGLAAAPEAWAKKSKKAPFHVNSLSVTMENIDGMAIGDFNGTDSQDILLIGRNSARQKQLELITLEKGRAAKEQLGLLNLPNETLFYDTAKLAKLDKQALLFLLPGKVSYFNPQSQTLETLVEGPSLYRETRRRTSFVNRIDFSIDVNGDDLSDIILPDFGHTRIYIQKPDGTFAPPQVIDMLAEMRLFRNNSAVYLGSALFINDHNFDGENDFVYRARDELHVFLQKNGVFEQKALVFPLDLAQPLSDEYDNFENDHSNMLTHSFFQLVDLNNDNMLDLITKLTRSSGLLDKDSQYQVYFGNKTEQGFVGYKKQPDSVIASEGLQFELKMMDFDGDEKLDLVSPSYDLGVGAIIGSLFSSSADLDIGFHKLNGSGIYNKKPNLERELTVDFNLSSGQNVYPLLTINDFNGDGVNDLLIGYGTKRVHLYPGEQGSSKLFERRAKRYTVKLPRDARLIASEDLNQDGKTDLVIRYGRLDGEGLNQQMKILLAD